MKFSQYLSSIFQFFNSLLFLFFFFIYAYVCAVITEQNKISSFTLILLYIPRNIYGFPITSSFFSFFFFEGDKGGSTSSNNPLKIHSTVLVTHQEVVFKQQYLIAIIFVGFIANSYCKLSMVSSLVEYLNFSSFMRLIVFYKQISVRKD